MALDVSVVVPVFNAGVNLDACMRSLLHQTLAPDRYEILLVDDGSTDGTGADIDAWAASHPERVRAFHEPHSGWAGRPRNVGVDNARGEYIHFVDSDDELPPRALERTLAAARESAADIVLPKSASDFRGVNHDIYRSNRAGTTWHDFPLIESLVPHKLLRREFVLEHGLRFDDEPRHVEDQLFVVHAYAHARSVAVVGDEVCYLFRRRRGFGRNLGDVPADPDDYYHDLGDVLDVIDRHVPAEADRLRLYERFFRVEVLGRLRDRPMLDYDPDYRRRLFQRIRRFVDERMPQALDERLPLFVAQQARLVRDHDLPGLLRFAEELATLTVVPHVDAVRWQGGGLHLDIDAAVTMGGEPLRLHPGPTDVADVVLTGRGDAATWFVPPSIPPARNGDTLGIRSGITLDPRRVLAGRPLTPGLWDLRLRVRVGGLTRTVRLTSARPEAEPRTDLPLCWYGGSPRSVLPYWTDIGGLALDVDGWIHSESDRVAADAVATPTGWQLPGIVAPTATRTRAALLVARDDAGMTQHAVVLQVGPEGGSLVRCRRATGALAWLRLGEPGGSAPARLP